MRHRGVGMGCLALLAGLTGCYENATLVTLNRDGSGDVVYRLFLSETMMDMLSGPAGGGPDILGEMPATLGRRLGGGATLHSSRTLTNRAGWAGFEAVYGFADINRIDFRCLDPTGGPDETARGPRDRGIGEDYLCTFIPGTAATLRLTPVTAAGLAGAAGEDPEVDTTDLPLETLRPMLRGMRVAFLVAVNGEILETNARFQSARRPNVVTLMDVRLDRLLDHPAGAALLQSGYRSGDPAAPEIPGVRMEPPNKEIVIRFK